MVWCVRMSGRLAVPPLPADGGNAVARDSFLATVATSAMINANRLNSERSNTGNYTKFVVEEKRVAPKDPNRNEFREFSICYYPEDGSIAVYEILDVSAAKRLSAREIVPRHVHLDPETNEPYHALYFDIGSVLHLPYGIVNGAPGPLSEFVITKVPEDLPILQNQLRAAYGNSLRSPVPSRSTVRSRDPGIEQVLDRIRASIMGNGLSAAEYIEHDKIGDLPVTYEKLVRNPPHDPSSVSTHELDVHLGNLGLPVRSADISQLVGAFPSRTKPGTIDYTAFLDGLSPELSEPRREALKKIFNTIDTNKNGVIDLFEVEKFYSRNLPILARFVQGVDKRVSWDNFARIYAGVGLSFADDREFSEYANFIWNKKAHYIV
eukprot:comp18229_c0_seq1/m.32207 comp18229_c0_seq1/g.32207  ORF comp18229_c0_seq1/g.32207 comp18229_c0_seq1/m.32207 type:complete len:378 (-) comp18229_c0_seq1:65-1198(-)